MKEIYPSRLSSAGLADLRRADRVNTAVDLGLSIGTAWAGGFGSAFGRAAGIVEMPSLTDGPYPGNMGFLGKPEDAVLPKGMLIDRYGDEGGTFASPAGTPAPMRSLHPDTPSNLNVYRVAKPITVKAGPAQPWFGQPSLGMQYKLPSSVGDLLASDALEPVH